MVDLKTRVWHESFRSIELSHGKQRRGQSRRYKFAKIMQPTHKSEMVRTILCLDHAKESSERGEIERRHVSALSLLVRLKGVCALPVHYMSVLDTSCGKVVSMTGRPRKIVS